jgi:hypothetical protein
MPNSISTHTMTYKYLTSDIIKYHLSNLSKPPTNYPLWVFLDVPSNNSLVYPVCSRILPCLLFQAAYLNFCASEPNALNHLIPPSHFGDDLNTHCASFIGLPADKHLTKIAMGHPNHKFPSLTNHV